ncbi:metal-dependent hydrolase [Antrihabitans sp. YC2-6]|uniref:metal-dependent hydrolase n=1 Tax=Antrihabitans sp. YC2-6 TaxID=2799498 RepID=UPI0018F5ADA3|nr:metal-dependent hydrolase [Antrihabitans sp. YC2-6]MBJ8344692.1 metal-dependent hydrolase [Antrihabitans sp. YC2-6]
MVALHHTDSKLASLSNSAPPKVRRMRFRFGDPEPIKKYFIEDDFVMSHLIALLSGSFPPGEESFIRSVRRFAGEITDPVLKKRVAGFIGQEAVHGQQHRELNQQLVELGYPLVRLLAFEPDSRIERLVVRLENVLPRAVHLAFTAAAEHYTATMAVKILADEDLRAIPGDPEIWNLLDWHAYEELEHKSVAFDVFRATGGSERTRIATMAFLYYAMIPFLTAAVLVSIATDPAAWRPIKVARQTIGLFRGPLLRGLMPELRVYMKRGFHPDDVDTSALLEQWQRQLFGTDAGSLVDRVKR